MQSSHPGGTPGRWSGQYHRSPYSRPLAGALFLLVLQVSQLDAQSSLLEAHILSGEGQVCRPGGRLPRPLVLQITDETGAGVAGALISFRVPDTGVSGTFHNGLKTEILSTDQSGRVELRSLEAGGFSGRFQIRMTIAKGEARAGAVSNQFIAPSPAPHGGLSGAFATLRPHGRWLEVGGLVLAVAAAGVIKTAIAGGGGSAAQAPPAIGPPTVTVGHP